MQDKNIEKVFLETVEKFSTDQIIFFEKKLAEINQKYFIALKNVSQQYNEKYKQDIEIFQKKIQSMNDKLNAKIENLNKIIKKEILTKKINDEELEKKIKIIMDEKMSIIDAEINNLKNNKAPLNLCTKMMNDMIVQNELLNVHTYVLNCHTKNIDDLNCDIDGVENGIEDIFNEIKVGSNNYIE